MKTAFLALYFFLLFFVSFYGIHLYWMILIYLKNRDKSPVPCDGDIGRSVYPTVTIQLPVYNEKRVAVRLIKAVAKLSYPHEKLEIQILDDSTDVTSELIKKTLKQLAKNTLAPKFSYLHRNHRTGFKAGALAEGLKQADGEFVAIFDADNLPDRDFLQRTIRFFNDQKIAMVQTRWGFLNSNESFLCRAQALFLDAHFVVEQQARYYGGLLFNFNGTAGIWRKKAINDVGGWEHDTLTEDLDLSIRAQLAGWSFIYDNSHIVPTELPNSISAFKSQQYRWAKGAIETAGKLLPAIFHSPLPRKAKIASFFHLTSKAISPALLLLAILLIPALYIRMESGIVKLFLIDFPLFIIGTGSMSLFYSIAYRHRNNRKDFKSLWVLPTLTSLGIALAVNNSKAFMSAMLKRKSPFIRTPKSGSTDIAFRKTPQAYFQNRDVSVYLEVLLSLYSLAACYIAFELNLYLTIPFLGSFLFGYTYFSFNGIKEAYAR